MFASWIVDPIVYNVWSQQYFLLMPIRCHCRSCKALLVSDSCKQSYIKCPTLLFVFFEPVCRDCFGVVVAYEPTAERVNNW